MESNLKSLIRLARPLHVVGLLFCFSFYLNAEEGSGSLFDLSLDELLDVQIVSTAAGYSQSISDAPATSSVIYAEQWEAQGARSLNDAIRGLPGVHLGKTVFTRGENSIQLRGLGGSLGEQILILVDGTPFRKIDDGSVFYGQRIPLINFERIEVIKGPASAIYGADAVGGVINLVSYDPGEAPTRAVLRRGSFDTFDAAFSTQTEIGESTLQIGFEYQRSDDDPGKIVESDLQTVFDSVFETTASEAPGTLDERYEIYGLKAQWVLGNLSLDIYDWQNLEAGLGPGVAQALDPEGFSRQHATNYNIRLDLSAEVEGELELKLSHRDMRLETLFHVFPAGSRFPIGAEGNIDFNNPQGVVDFPEGYIGRPGIDAKADLVSLTHIFPIGDKHLIRLEGGVEYTKVNSQERKNFGPGIIDGTISPVGGRLTDVTDTPWVYLPNSSRDVYFLSIQDQWKIREDLNATIGVRHDRYSDFGDTTNPRLGLIWQQSESLRWKLFAGTAFRAPSLWELGVSNNPAGLGNPNLGPEEIETLDGGISLDYLLNENLQLSFTSFHYEIENVVRFVPEPVSNTQVAQNAGEQRGKGFEIGLNWRGIDNLAIEANYSQTSYDNGQGQLVHDLPNSLANLGVHWTPGEKFHLYTGAKWVGDRKRAPADSRPKIDDFLWGSTQLSYRFDAPENSPLHGVTLSLSAENLFDEKAYEPSNGSIPGDYPLMGRQFILETSFEF